MTEARAIKEICGRDTKVEGHAAEHRCSGRHPGLERTHYKPVRLSNVHPLQKLRHAQRETPRAVPHLQSGFTLVTFSVEAHALESRPLS